MSSNVQIKLAARPEGLPKKTDWNIVETDIPLPGDGEILVQIIYISLDPAMRGWMSAARSYVPPVRIGQVMRAGTLGKVIESKNPKFKTGDFVTGMQGVQLYGISKGDDLVVVDPKIAPLQKYLSVLGMTGMTAYFAFLEVGKPKPGDNVVVSGAAGAVGQIVGQIARIKECHPIGIAGGESKCKEIVENFGYEHAIDYKKENVGLSLMKYLGKGKGVDVYFDNVGGDILDSVLGCISRGARIVICGAISQYNNTGETTGPKNYMSLLVNRARMEGFVVFDYYDSYPQAISEMIQWMQEGKLKSKEDIVFGIETFPETLLQLYSGGNTGKLLIQTTKDI